MNAMASPTEFHHDDAAGLVRCSRCPTVGYADDRFCPACGAPMLARCGSCGAVVTHLIAAFCTRCGARLGGEGSGAAELLDR